MDHNACCLLPQKHESLAETRGPCATRRSNIRDDVCFCEASSQRILKDVSLNNTTLRSNQTPEKTFFVNKPHKISFAQSAIVLVNYVTVVMIYGVCRKKSRHFSFVLTLPPAAFDIKWSKQYLAMTGVWSSETVKNWRCWPQTNVPCTHLEQSLRAWTPHYCNLKRRKFLMLMHAPSTDQYEDSSRHLTNFFREINKALQ